VDVIVAAAEEEVAEATDVAVIEGVVD